MKKKERDSRMELREDGGVPYFIFKNLEETGLVRHGFSTRLGGVSEGYLASMNLSFTRGDREENVRENFRRMGRAIGFIPENLVLSDQTHTDHVRLMTEADRGKGYTKPLDYQDVDGMVTDVPGLVLTTFYADCVPLYFVDPVHRAIGLSHSGWKGTVKRIGAVTLEKMSAAFGTRPEDVRAAIDLLSARTVMRSVKMWRRRSWRNLAVRRMKGCSTGKKTENTSWIYGEPMNRCCWKPVFFRNIWK